MSKDKLKPCPFCGGKSKLLLKKEMQKPVHYAVKCSACPAEMYYWSYYGFITKEQSITAWNKRNEVTS